MAIQHIGSHQIEMVTPGELSAQLHQHHESTFGRILRERYRGIKLLKIPRIVGIAPSAAPFTLYPQQSASPAGPDSGYLWHLRRITVASGLANDPARYVLYGGSDSTATPGQLIDAGPQDQIVSQASPVNNVPVGATGVASFNNNAFGVNVTVATGTATFSGNTTVNGVNTGATTGTFFVPAGGTITTNYSAGAPVYTTAGVNAFTQTIVSGLAVGQAYYPATKGLWLWPGETLYAIISNPTANTQYSLSGIAIEVPFEMQGKIL